MRAFIFDLDGVIVHTDRYHYLGWKRLADENGIFFDETINNRLRGVSRMESLEIILERSTRVWTAEEKLAAAEKKNAYYRDMLTAMSPSDVTEEVRGTLERLRAAGYFLAIGSSSKNAGLILARVGLGKFFDAVSDGNHIARSKPDPEVFLRAAKLLDLTPEECYVVEDAFSGIDAATAGGFVPIAIGDAVKSDRAKFRLCSFADLLKLI